MANIQQVRYPVPQQAPWAQALQGAVGGAMSGMSGYYGRRQQEQKNLMSLLPVLAQMKMLTPGGSDIKVPGTGLSFGVGSPATDYGELENKAQYDKIKYENENRDLLAKRNAAEKAFQAIVSADPSALPQAWKAYDSIMQGGPGITENEKVEKWTPSDWEEAGGLSRFIGAATPWHTETEKKLGTMRWGATPTKKQKIILPSEIKTTSQAIKYLKDTHKMTDNQAKEWIRLNG